MQRGKAGERGFIVSTRFLDWSPDVAEGCAFQLDRGGEKKPGVQVTLKRPAKPRGGKLFQEGGAFLQALPPSMINNKSTWRVCQPSNRIFFKENRRLSVMRKKAGERKFPSRSPAKPRGGKNKLSHFSPAFPPASVITIAIPVPKSSRIWNLFCNILIMTEIKIYYFF